MQSYLKNAIPEVAVSRHALFSTVLTIQFNRINKKNALNVSMYKALSEALIQAEQDQNITAVLFCGTPGCFTSGNDIQDFAGQDITALQAVIGFLKVLSGFNKPLMAVVDGLAIGIGTTMLLHCDFVYATDSSTFMLPFVKLGLCPEAASSVLLAKRIGICKANEMLLLGSAMSGKMAAETGLINASFEEIQALDVVVNRTLKSLSTLPKNALARSKQLIKCGGKTTHDLHQIIDTECSVFIECLQSEEAKLAFSQFLTSSVSAS